MKRISMIAVAMMMVAFAGAKANAQFVVSGAVVSPWVAPVVAAPAPVVVTPTVVAPAPVVVTPTVTTVVAPAPVVRTTTVTTTYTTHPAILF